MRLIIVSNRLPITLVKNEGGFQFKESVGGLVSGLSAYLGSLKDSYFKKSDYLWVGWPGSAVDKKSEKKIKTEILTKYNAYPVFIPERAMDKFYLGFCNKTIWPLFHYFPSYMVWDNDYWEHYLNVNETFCNSLLEIYEPDDILWVHDYHLMLLPALIRKKRPDATIGFFLHIPFPSFEIFRLLPSKQRIEILKGMLGADLIGFHTHEYTQYFLRCVLRILGVTHNFGQIFIDGRSIKVDTFPMGIEFHKYNNALNDPRVIKEREKLKRTLGGFKVILSIDRLDYTKGTVNRLRAYELFLEKNPEWHNKIILIMIVVPSRIGVEHYQLMKKQIDEMVGKINGKFGSINWTPIIYQYKFLSFHSLSALYSLSNVALVTPLRDGMNLVAKEYVAGRKDRTGVLILSEMAGTSKELREAIIINPNNIEEIAQAIVDALNMPEDEQIRRNQAMQDRLRAYDVIKWADEFIIALKDIKNEQKKLQTKLLDLNLKNQILKDYKNAKRRLLFLDYDGTLVPFSPLPYLAKPSDEVLRILNQLSRHENNTVVLISGRDKDTLGKWFADLNIYLVAEHGIWIKDKNSEWRLLKELVNTWKPQIIPILKRYTNRLKDSFIEEKDFSIAWHYRNADPEEGSEVAKELIDELVHLTANIDLLVMHGKKAIEVRNSGVHKGTACQQFISRGEYDFILAIGDDWTDEDMFGVLPENAYTIRVGMECSYARYNLHSPTDVLKLLNELLEIS